MSPKLSIPDRWLEYKSVGKQIDVTPFLAFKVPLKQTFFDNVSTEQKFSPSDLIKLVPNLALVIDLTNTLKYYNDNDFRSRGIEYKKIFCPGHVIPPRKLINEFFRIVDEFMLKTKRSNEEGRIPLIGVHCTHGINRTGFFICSYMIHKMGYNSEKAIFEFNSARGHNIERENYLNELKRYDKNPLQFKASRYKSTNSTSDLNYDGGIDDRIISPKFTSRQNPSISRTGAMYRPPRNHYQNNRPHKYSTVYYPPFNRQDFTSFQANHVNINSGWQHSNRQLFTPYMPELRSMEPYSRSVQCRGSRNGKTRKY